MPPATDTANDKRSIVIKNFQEAFCANGAKTSLTFRDKIHIPQA
jgi:hypothetical protein